MSGYKVRLGGLLVSVAALFAPTGASAETLTDALISAYRHNPKLNSARAGQRAVDEGVAQALSGWRPTINARGTAGTDATYRATYPQSLDFLGNPIKNDSYAQDTAESLNITLNQPLFRGFRTVESTAVAEAEVKAGQQQLLVVEQGVLLNAIQAYVAVLRDRKILQLRQRYVGVLQGQARATNLRFSAGELTRTDVAQANASVAGAKASLAVAQSNLKGSEANFTQYVGHAPGKLSPARKAKPPASLDQAYGIAHKTNPNILAAAQQVDALDHQIGVVGSALLPQADLQGSYTFSATQEWADGAPTGNDSTRSSLQLQAVVSVPIYEGGAVYSQVRQAKQRASQQRLNVIDSVRQVRQGVAASWAAYHASGQSVTSNKQQVSAAAQALDGVRQEYAVGSRSTVDVLNAEQLLVNAQIQQVSAEHDLLASSYQLQSALGHLTARHLHLGELYDPNENYNRVRDKWIGTDAEVLK